MSTTQQAGNTLSHGRVTKVVYVSSNRKGELARVLGKVEVRENQAFRGLIIISVLIG